MAIFKNIDNQKLFIYAYDTTNEEAKTGDAANITAQISLDGGASAATNDTNPTELDSTDHPGIYYFDLTQAETNTDVFVVTAVSSTADIEIDPVTVYTVIQQTGDSYTRLGTPAGASVSADVAAVKTDTGNLVTRITSTLFSGITSLAEWLGLIAGKQAGDSTARSELRSTGAGSGTFDETHDSLEAVRDRGDTAWETATGFSTFDPAADTVAHVTLVDTTTTNSDMRGTDGANTTTPPTANENADAVLGRSISNIEDTADINSLAAVVMALFNSNVVGTDWIIKKTDDSTFTIKTLTSDASADPVTGVT